MDWFGSTMQAASLEPSMFNSPPSLMGRRALRMLGCSWGISLTALHASCKVACRQHGLQLATLHQSTLSSCCFAALARPLLAGTPAPFPAHKPDRSIRAAFPGTHVKTGGDNPCSRLDHGGRRSGVAGAPVPGCSSKDSTVNLAASATTGPRRLLRPHALMMSPHGFLALGEARLAGPLGGNTPSLCALAAGLPLALLLLSA